MLLIEIRHCEENISSRPVSSVDIEQLTGDWQVVGSIPTWRGLNFFLHNVEFQTIACGCKLYRLSIVF